MKCCPRCLPSSYVSRTACVAEHLVLCGACTRQKSGKPAGASGTKTLASTSQASLRPGAGTTRTHDQAHGSPTYPPSRICAKKPLKISRSAQKRCAPHRTLWPRARPHGSFRSAAARSARNQCLDQQDARSARRNPAFELTADKTLRIKYADRWTIAWKCVLDDNNNVTDLLPARNGLPDGDQAPYTTYPLASFPSLEPGSERAAVRRRGRRRESVPRAAARARRRGHPSPRAARRPARRRRQQSPDGGGLRRVRGEGRRPPHGFIVGRCQSLR